MSEKFVTSINLQAAPVSVKVINKSDNPLPQYQTEGSAGMDVSSNEDITISPGWRQAVGTGLYLEIPKGYEVQVRSRSGLAIKNGVSVLNSPGTIDSDYRGEIGIILINEGTYPFEIKKGDRIAQLVLQPVIQMKFEEVEELSDTERGSGGFGSSGI